MPGSEDRTIDWSPWKHPKARRWFEELLEKTHLPLMMEHAVDEADDVLVEGCLLYTSPSPRDQRGSRMPSSA